MKTFKGYFANQRILIADDSTSTRIAIARAFSQLGACTAQMNLTDSYDWAKELISRNHFTILVCEYDLDKRCGLELLRLLPDLGLSIVVTRNHSEVAAARSAELGVDLFLTKPFTTDAFTRAVARAIQPPEIELHRQSPPPGPQLHRSLDKINRTQRGSKADRKTGYRALVSLHEALLAQGQKDAAYEALRKLIRGYPLEPTRLSSALRLAVETRHFEDIESYYLSFLKVDDKGEELVRHVCAALVMAGKAQLQSNQLQKALDHFKKAVVSSGRRFSILREIALALLNHGHPDQADRMLSFISEQERTSLEFLVLDYRVSSRLQPLHSTLKRGRELIRQGHSDPVIYEILIDATVKAGHLSEAESLAMDATRYWPEQGPGYRALLPEPQA